MEKRTGRSRNYQWAIAVVMGVILVIGGFAFYAIGVIRAHQDETNRQIFRGLNVIAQDVSDSLDTLERILPSFKDLGPDDFRKKVDDLRQTSSYQDLNISRKTCGLDASNSLEFKQSLIIHACDISLEAFLRVGSLVDGSYVEGLVDTVLIADSMGQVLSETENQMFAHLTNMKPYLEENGLSVTGVPIAGSDAKITNANGRLYPAIQSTVVPIVLSGREISLFVQPQVLSLRATSADRLFFKTRRRSVENKNDGNRKKENAGCSGPRAADAPYRCGAFHRFAPRR